MSFCLQTGNMGHSSAGEPLHKAGTGSGIVQWAKRLSENNRREFESPVRPKIVLPVSLRQHLCAGYTFQALTAIYHCLDTGNYCNTHLIGTGSAALATAVPYAVRTT